MGAGVLAASACGPAVVLPEETGSESDTEGTDTVAPPPDTETSTTSTTSTTTPPTGTGVECYEDEDCPGSYWDCVDNVCIEEYYCLDCCYEDDCYYGGCYGDSDCGFAEICNDEYGYGECQSFNEIPQCDEALTMIPLPIGGHGGEPVISLSFVPSDTPQAEDLIIGTATGAHIARFANGPNPQLVTVSEEPIPAAGAIGADFFEDDGIDIAVIGADGSDGTNASLWRADGAGGFAFDRVSTGIAGPPLYVHAARTEQGTVDAVFVTDDGAGLRQGLRLTSAELPFDVLNAIPDVEDLVVADINGDGVDDLAVDAGDFTSIRFEVSGAQTSEGIPGRPGRLLAAGAGSGADRDDVFAVTSFDEWVLIETYVDQGYQAHSLIGAPVSVELATIGAGAIDGDAASDLVMLQGDQITIIFGGESGTPRCWSSTALAAPETHMTLGDFTGSGRSGIAVSDGNSVEVLSLGEP